MKFLMTAAAALFVFAASPASAALPQCSSNFCAGAANGGNCQIAGKIHTCGKCTGTPNGILYVGDLSPATAEEKCKTHVNKDTMTVKGATVKTTKLKAPSKTKALTR